MLKKPSFTILHSKSNICIYALVTSVDCIATGVSMQVHRQVFAAASPGFPSNQTPPPPVCVKFNGAG